jgi:hypothetical protein
MEVHWKNPFEDAVPVPIEELVECVYGINEEWKTSTGVPLVLTKRLLLLNWGMSGDKLDAYILPTVGIGGWHSIGIRYGNEGHQYLSPYGDEEKVMALLAKYQALDAAK